MAAGALSSLLVGMATSDCEAIRDAWLAQPANAWSSGAYLLAGVYLVIRDRAVAAATPAPTPVVLTLGAVAVGSFLYHGPQPAWGDAVHDGTIALLLGTLACRGGASGPTQGPYRPILVVLLLALVVAAAVLVVAMPRSVATVHGALAGIVAIRTWRTLRRSGATPAAHVTLAALAVGLVLFAVGRSGGPLCEPRSLVQPHAGWHVATAVAAAGLVTIDVRARPRHPTAP